MQKIGILLSCLFFTFLGNAQNLIQNSGFEMYSNTNFPFWNISSGNFEVSTQAHSGNRSLRLYANGDFVRTFQNGNFNIISVEGRKKYIISGWLKGETASEKTEITILWYDAQNSRISSKTQAFSLTNQWKEFSFETDAPPLAQTASLSVRVLRGAGNSVYLDDFSMIEKENENSEELPEPSGVKAFAFQREIELSWDKERDTSIRWEVIVDENSPKTITETSFIAENLEPNTAHTLKIRAVKGNRFSSYKTLLVTTKHISKLVQSFERIPHLRTLGENGEASQNLKLYYNDLANKNVEILYWIDNVKVTPVNNTLIFPRKGKQKLKININEGGNFQWKLKYDVTIK